MLKGLHLKNQNLCQKRYKIGRTTIIESIMETYIFYDLVKWHDCGCVKMPGPGGYLHVLWWACCQIIGSAVWATHLSTWTWVIWPHPCQLPSRVSLLNSWAPLSPLTCQHNLSHKICIMLQFFSFIRKGNYNSNNFLISYFFCWFRKCEWIWEGKYSNDSSRYLFFSTIMIAVYFFQLLW